MDGETMKFPYCLFHLMFSILSYKNILNCLYWLLTRI